MDSAPFPKQESGRSSWSPGLALLKRWLTAILCGVAAYTVVRGSAERPVALLLGWDVTLLVSLALPWVRIIRSTPDSCRSRATQDDPGDLLLLISTLTISVGSLLAALFILTQPDKYGSGFWADLEPVLVGICIVAGWAVLQTGFTLHYARQYYRDDGSPGGLDFKGEGPPDDLDFAYVAFGIGVAFQVSDVDVSARDIRRTVLVHSVISFFYSAAVLALAINIVAGKIGN